MEDIEQFELKLQLEQIRLTNFRGFGDISMNFHPELTVIIGENGTGKTTLLDAIASLLQFWVNSIKNDVKDKLEIFSNKDIKNDTNQAINQITVSVSENSFFKAPVLVEYEEEEEAGKPKKTVLSDGMRWYAELHRDKSGYEGDSSDELGFSRLSPIRRRLSNAVAQKLPISIPVLVYYPCAYAPIEYNLAAGSSRFELLSAYDDALDKKAFDFSAFYKWFEWQYKKSGLSIAPQTLIHTVSEAIYSVLSDENMVYSNLSIDYEQLNEGELLIEKNGEILKVNQFSSGEKTIFSLVADLARRLAIANPRNENPLHQSGVVLIDEIDLHLHPRWQRKIIPALIKTFPKVQWVVTTHSPQVLGEVEGDQYIYISEQQTVRLLDFNTYGKDMNRLLSRIMGVPERNENILKQLDDYFELIELNQWNDEKALELRAKLEKEIGTDEPLFRRADGIIQRKILIGR